MHSYMPCHLVFGVNMEFTPKALYVTTWCYASQSYDSRYAGVVSRESVHISFTYSAANGIDMTEADIHNAYLTENCYEEYWIRCGPEFGLEHEGNQAIIVQALYGILLMIKNFLDLLRNCMKPLVFQSCHADPDVWL